jgi:hypothetical protein
MPGGEGALRLAPGGALLDAVVDENAGDGRRSDQE